MPTSGTILINRKSIKEYNRDEYYRLIIAVFQDVKFLPTTLRKNIVSYEAESLDILNDMDERVWKCLELSGMKQK